jgi:hypothetical protein
MAGYREAAADSRGSGPDMGLGRVRECARTLVRGCVALAACACAVSHAGAQTVSAPDLKAAFLFNFAQFAGWPADALTAHADLIFCVAGDPDVARSLEHSVTGRAIDGHRIVVRRLDATDAARACHMFYSSGLDREQASRLLESLKGASVFTVSDLTDFAGMGGIAQLFPENGRMRFAVNVEASQRGRLQLSSKLLSLAKIVKDDGYASAR